MKVIIISGTHKGKVGDTIGIFKEANTCIVELEDGSVVKVRLNEVERMEI